MLPALGRLTNHGPPPNGNGTLDISVGIPNQLVQGNLTLQAGIVQPNANAHKNLTNGVEVSVP